MTDELRAPDRVLEVAGVRAGIRTDGAELIRDGSNTLYQLPAGIVARISRNGTQETARREVDMSRWLTRKGLHVVQAIRAVPQPTMVGDRPVTWWELLPAHRPATPSELGSMLRALHALSIPEQLALPEVDPFSKLADRIAAADILSFSDRSWLVEHLARLRNDYTNLPPGLPRQVIHGDAWQGNIAVLDGGDPVMLDLEHVGLGSPEWDLTTLAVDRTDFERITAEEYRAFVDAYGGYDVTDWPGFRTLANIRELRWVCFTLSHANTNSVAADEARHRVACLQGGIPRPWSWSAF